MPEHGHKHEVRIHIDQHRYESPNPTSGHALYGSERWQLASNSIAKLAATRKTNLLRMAPRSFT